MAVIYLNVVEGVVERSSLKTVQLRVVRDDGGRGPLVVIGLECMCPIAVLFTASPSMLSVD